ncbi:hypothetical protein [Tumebacillus flagellatus]|uniref:Uncharacterized protein n=1 Tax=Tumebacillus flagellatus TaxID=1157490 RepID=A0A074LT06_9BACL|nr:hypothetical protein [Tumebacillus flagellatus]KEO82998.1 hypothetical protein EL26_11955 [Tumebacillus flagellatus]
MTVQQTDPLQSITQTLRTLTTPMGVVTVSQSWPDPNVTSVETNLPCLFVYPVRERGTYIGSVNTVFATVKNADDTTATIYREKQRKTYELRLTLVTATADELSRIGWKIEQALNTNTRLNTGNPLVDIVTFTYFGQYNAPPSDAGAHQRDMTFNVSVRVLDAETVYLLKKLSLSEDSDLESNL